jgi:hypothetical protein
VDQIAQRHRQRRGREHDAEDDAEGDHRETALERSTPFGSETMTNDE